VINGDVFEFENDDLCYKQLQNYHRTQCVTEKYTDYTETLLNTMAT